MSLTLTTTAAAAATTCRPRSLSLFASGSLPLPTSQPAILRIPPELVLDILETTCLSSKPSIFNIAVTCKALSSFIDTLIYRTVVLDSPKRVSLFNRTVKSKSHEFLRSHVKEIAVTCESYNFGPQTIQQIAQIICSCAGLRKLAVPTPFELAYLHPTSNAFSSPSEIVVDSFVAVNTPTLPTSSAFVGTTRLRICEPSDGWFSPSSIISTFGPLPNLTHLHLPRRAEANEDNDISFAEDVKFILATRPNLKSFVVSVFPLQWRDEETAKDSHIWNVLSEVQKGDNRLLLVIGRYGEWRAEYDAPAFLPRANFWDMSPKRAAGPDSAHSDP